MKSNIVYADLSEMLFEGRNKSYGGYFLRQTTNANLVKGLATAVSIFLLLFLIFRNKDTSVNLINLNETLETFIVDLNPLPEPEKLEILKSDVGANKAMESTAPAPKPESQELLNPTPKPDEEVKKEATITPTDSLLSNPGKETVIGGTAPGPGGPGGPGNETGTGKEKEKIDENKAYESNAGLSFKPFATNMGEVRKGIRYPAQLLDIGFEGKVELKVLVNKEGKVEEIKVLKSTHPLFTEVCKINAQKLIFEPGKMGDSPVRVWVTIPFVFKNRN